MLTLLITLMSLVSFTQESLICFAYQFCIGKITYDDKIKWNDTPRNVEVLVQFNVNEIIVYSKEHQVYQIVEEIGRKNNTVMWKATDKKGSYCWLFMTNLDHNTDIALTVRYSDCAWMYICKNNNIKQ